MLANWLTALLLAIRFPLIWVWISNPGRIADIAQQTAPSGQRICST